ncbi:MAG TPA: enoyl-CoA hydratase/isomerase family protein [Mycobacteriales bacterium]|jgi:enoyl-CoA hydratase/carnithine racemase|nr:enoyl-CoA hydratase/isomerase family protein [Mycobacteriales bacterium]
MTDDELAEVGLLLRVDGPVATVTLNRPERRNAQTPAMWTALARLGRELPGDVRVVVVTGAGPSFSAGLDLQMFTPEGIPGAPSFLDLARSSDADADATIAAFQEAFTWLLRPDLLTVAAVRGHAVGAGFQLALAADFRVCAADATFTMAEVTRGIVPDLGGTGLLTALVGYSRALEICVTGRRVGADEAVRIGLATVAVPDGELEAAVSDLVAALLAAPRDAAVETKALLLGARTRGLAEQRAAEREAQLRRLRDLAGIGE